MNNPDYKYKIDLHCHSTASDGDENVLKLLDIADAQNLCCLVLTDHFRRHTPSYRDTKGALYCLRDILVDRIPVFVGAEIDSPFGHLNVYGDKAIKQIFKNLRYLHDLRKDLNKWSEEFIKITSRSDIKNTKLESMVILNHPEIDKIRSMPKILRNYIKVYEITSGGFDIDWTVVEELRSLFPESHQIATSDHHGGDLLGSRYILVERPPKTIEDLIHIVKKGKFAIDIKDKRPYETYYMPGVGISKERK